jgi:hypothetical protein
VAPPCVGPPSLLGPYQSAVNGERDCVQRAGRALATFMAGVPLFAAASVEVPRLLEMCADNRASHAHGRERVAGALATMFGTPPLPDTALGATGAGVTARIERLLPAGTTHTAPECGSWWR